jgi:hypothetical protein
MDEREKQRRRRWMENLWETPDAAEKRLTKADMVGSARSCFVAAPRRLPTARNILPAKRQLLD